MQVGRWMPTGYEKIPPNSEIINFASIKAIKFKK